MIIDLILDRKDFGTVFMEEYTPKRFYDAMMEYGGGFGEDIARAMDGGTEEDVKRMLCFYIDRGEYNPEIKDYINSVDWLIMS